MGSETDWKDSDKTRRRINTKMRRYTKMRENIYFYFLEGIFLVLNFMILSERYRNLPSELK